MRRGPSAQIMIAKEVRALAPVWCGATAALIGAFVLSRVSDFMLAVPTYVSGVLLVAAHAIGHEYANRTLPILLVQPASRARLFGVKCLALTALGAAIAGTAAIIFALDGWEGSALARVVTIPILGAVFAAPLFTMMCRSTLAGAILAPSAGMVLLLLATLITGIDFLVPITWFIDHTIQGALIVCPLLAAVTWYWFSRIEAVDPQLPAMTFLHTASEPGRSASGTRRHAPWRALVAKEIRMQQKAIAVMFVCAAVSSLAVASIGARSLGAPPPVAAVLMLYCLGLAIVIGAVASAGERQLETREIQMLFPVSVARQWSVKCAVTLILGMTFGVVVPMLLFGVFADALPWSIASNLIAAVIMLTASGLYFSSLTNSVVKAMAWLLPAGLAAAIFFETMRAFVTSASTAMGVPVPADHAEAPAAMAPLLVVLVVPVLWRFGFVNHTWAERSWLRMLTQIGVLAALIVAAIIGGGVLI